MLYVENQYDWKLIWINISVLFNWIQKIMTPCWDSCNKPFSQILFWGWLTQSLGLVDTVLGDGWHSSSIWTPSDTTRCKLSWYLDGRTYWGIARLAEYYRTWWNIPAIGRLISKCWAIPGHCGTCNQSFWKVSFILVSQPSPKRCIK